MSLYRNSIVPTDVNYTYSLLRQNISSLKNIYPFLEISIIGYSILGKPIPYIRFGKGPKEVFYSASIHANEWITSVVLMKFLEDICQSYSSRGTIGGRDTVSIFNSFSLYICPMLNPDGVDLVTSALSTSSKIYKKVQKIASNFPDIPFPNGWKANMNGVDLNLQFPAGWETAKEIKYSQGYNKPAPRDFVGIAPLSEPESRAVFNFTINHNFRLILTYHTQGKVIYWQFQDYMPPNALMIGQEFSRVSGYSLEDTPYNSSFAGYKDWFIQTYNRPGYTIEAGLGENPLPISQFDEIYRNNLGILVLGAIL